MNNLNMLILADDLSGSEIGLLYRPPTSKEYMAYNNAVILRKGNKVIFRYPEAQEKYGKQILKGIRGNDFNFREPDGKRVIISSDPDSKHYREDWLALLWERRAYLILTFASKVFGTPAEVLDEMEDTLEPGDEEEVDEDAEKD